MLNFTDVPKDRIINFYIFGKNILSQTLLFCDIFVFRSDVQVFANREDCIKVDLRILYDGPCICGQKDRLWWPSSDFPVHNPTFLSQVWPRSLYFAKVWERMCVKCWSPPSKDLYSTTAEFPFSVNSNICLVLLCVISMFWVFLSL